MTFESVDYGDEDEATVPEPADSWCDDAPITDEQIEAVRRDLDTPVAQRGAAFAPFVVRKLLAEVDRLREQLQSATVLPERWREVLAERDAAKRELEEMRERIERVRHHAQHPRASSGLIRDYVYARDILALLGDEKAVDDV